MERFTDSDPMCDCNKDQYYYEFSARARLLLSSWPDSNHLKIFIFHCIAFLHHNITIGGDPWITVDNNNH